jgi:hypothetical protein
MRAQHEAIGCCEGVDALRVHQAHGSCCGMTRRFPSRAERRKALEAYQDQLKNELVGVEERLKKSSE